MCTALISQSKQLTKAAIVPYARSTDISKIRSIFRERENVWVNKRDQLTEWVEEWMKKKREIKNV